MRKHITAGKTSWIKTKLDEGENGSPDESGRKRQVSLNLTLRRKRKNTEAFIIKPEKLAK